MKGGLVNAITPESEMANHYANDTFGMNIPNGSQLTIITITAR